MGARKLRTWLLDKPIWFPEIKTAVSLRRAGSEVTWRRVNDFPWSSDCESREMYEWVVRFFDTVNDGQRLGRYYYNTCRNFAENWTEDSDCRIILFGVLSPNGLDDYVEARFEIVVTRETPDA